jgi:hypothetical protein
LKKILLEEKDEQLNNRIIPTYWSGKTNIRTNSFRLANDNNLYDMRKDPDQTININNEFPDQFKQLLQWKNERQ